MLDRTTVSGSPCVIHFVDMARMKEELRPVCGAWGDDVTWTTLLAIATCPDCALALREDDSGTIRRLRTHRPVAP